MLRARVGQGRSEALSALGRQGRPRHRNPLALQRGERRRRRRRLRRLDEASPRSRRRPAHGGHGSGRKRNRHDPRRPRLVARSDEALPRAGAAGTDGRIWRQHKDDLIPEFRAVWEAGRRQNRRHVGGSLRPRARHGRNLHGLALRPLHEPCRRSRQGRVSAADVRQRGADPARLSARPLSQRRAPAPSDRRLAGRRAGDRFPRARHLLSRTSSSGAKSIDRGGNPLFIPEAVRESRSAANIFYAVGQHDAMGLSPFAIDHINDPQVQPLRQSYELLEQLAPLILEHQGRGTMAGVVPNVPFEGGPIPTSSKSSWAATRSTSRSKSRPKPTNTPGLDPGEWLSGGVILHEGPHEYLIAGTGLIVTFAPSEPNSHHERAGISQHRSGPLRRRRVACDAAFERRRKPSGPPSAYPSW